MSTQDRALELLATLNAEDRNWILGRLSPAAKARLMAGRAEGAGRTGGVESSGSGRRPAAAERSDAVADPGDSITALVEKLSAADPDVLASVLASEPAWLVSAILRIRDWPWSKRFLHALPPSIRVEVMELERQGTRLARPARELALRALVSRLGASWDVAAPVTRFDAVLTRFRKVRRA